MGAAGAFVLLLIAQTQSVLLDRIAVTVGSEVITEGQVFEEIRTVALLNGKEPDFSPAERRRTAGRLVDQELLRREMRITRFPEPEWSDAEKTLDELKRKRYSSEAAFQEALAAAGVSERQLLEHLRWEIALVRFTDYRFHLTAAGPGGARPDGVDRQMEAWLKQARANTRIRYFEEAFR
jgi:hypothetical protein